MKNLFLCEWQRLWQRKSTWLTLILIPAALFAILNHYIKTNPHLTAAAFQGLLLQKELVPIFDVIIIVLTIISITSEYRSGELRMIMLRAPFRMIIKAKCLVLISIVILLMSLNFILSNIFGYCFLPHNGNIGSSLIYDLKYYLIAFLTLMAIASLILLLSLICPSNLSVLCSSLVFLFLSLEVPNLYSAITNSMSEAYKFMMFSFIPQIQIGEIPVFLQSFSKETKLMAASILFHIVVFSLAAYNLFKKRDYLF